MSLKLNLGAGRVIFPLDRAAEIPHRMHLEPLPDICFEPGWVNVDKYLNAGIAETTDLFRFPWIRSSTGLPWADNSVDAIYAGHLVEHIPHQVAVANKVPLGWRKQYDRLVERLDGWFVWFYEAWRILKPDGELHVRCPYALSYAAVTDPTHTRSVVPGSFSYLAGGRAAAPFDYQVPCHFELAEPVALRFTADFAGRLNELSPEAIAAAPTEHWNAVDEIRVVLRAVKGADSERSEP